MTPLDYETDREMLAAALGTIGLAEPPQARLLWIADTLHLGEVECSAAYLDEARQRGDLEILGRAARIALRRRGQSAAVGRRPFSGRRHVGPGAEPFSGRRHVGPGGGSSLAADGTSALAAGRLAADGTSALHAHTCMSRLADVRRPLNPNFD